MADQGRQGNRVTDRSHAARVAESPSVVLLSRLASIACLPFMGLIVWGMYTDIDTLKTWRATATQQIASMEERVHTVANWLTTDSIRVDQISNEVAALKAVEEERKER